jgi:exonuclease SbcC
MNGAGKSTIIEAVAWALYGNEIKIVRTKKEDLKRFGAGPAEVCEINLEFELDGDKYCVNRKMSGKSFQTTAEISVNGTSVATTTKSVTDLVEKRLGMDYQAFYTSVFAKQKELNALSTLDPNKRKKLILRMLNIDSIDKAIISIRKDVRDFKTRLSELRTVLLDIDGTPKIESAKVNIILHTEKIDEISLGISKLEKEKENMQEEFSRLELARTKMRKQRDDFSKLKTKLSGCDLNIKNASNQSLKIETELKTLNGQKKELEKLKPQKDEWKSVKKRKDELEELHGKFIHASELRKQIKKGEGQVKEYTAHLEKAREGMKKFEELGKRMKECQDGQEKVNNEIDEVKRIISEHNSKKELMDSESKKLENRLNDIQNLGPDSKCPTCERELGDHFQFLKNKFKTELDEYTQKKEILNKSISVSKKSLKDAEKRFEALRKRYLHLTQEEKEHARTEANLKTYESELAQNNAHLDKLVAELEKFKDLKYDPDEYSRVKSAYLQLEKVNEKIIALDNSVKKIPKYEEELNGFLETSKNLVAEKEQLGREIANLGFEEKKLEELENKYDNNSQKLKDHELIIKGKENDLNLHKKDIKQLTDKISELQEQEKRASGYENELMYRTKLDSCMNRFKNYMISRIAPTLTQYASDLFRELTDGKYNRMEVDNDYNVFIYDNGEAFPLSRYSGGEEDLANLCLRLAISQVISAQVGTTGPSFVILDEIFGSQDVHRKRNLLQALNGLTNKFRQIFLITHIEDVKDFIEYNIMVTENDDFTSSVEIVG